jgi:hypothetical protein
MDERLVVAMYGDTTILLREYFTNGLDGGSKRAVVNAVTVACFIMFPLLWSAMMTWIGVKAGSGLKGLLESAHRDALMAGAITNNKVGGATTGIAKKILGK